MRSFLKVTVPTVDLTVLTAEELRVSAGIDASDTSKDTALADLADQAMSNILIDCHIAIGAGAEPTLKQETLEQTVYKICRSELILSRRHNVEIITIVEDGAPLVSADFICDPESGILVRLTDDLPSYWSADKIVVTYKAGFETAPSDLKKAVGDFVRAIYASSNRDPFVKSDRVNIPGVEETETTYWVGSVPGMGSNSGNAVPDIVAGNIKRFRNSLIG